MSHVSNLFASCQQQFASLSNNRREAFVQSKLNAVVSHVPELKMFRHMNYNMTFIGSSTKTLNIFEDDLRIFLIKCAQTKVFILFIGLTFSFARSRCRRLKFRFLEKQTKRKKKKISFWIRLIISFFSNLKKKKNSVTKIRAKNDIKKAIPTLSKLYSNFSITLVLHELT